MCDSDAWNRCTYVQYTTSRNTLRASQSSVAGLLTFALVALTAVLLQFHSSISQMLGTCYIVCMSHDAVYCMSVIDEESNSLP